MNSIHCHNRSFLLRLPAGFFRARVFRTALCLVLVLTAAAVRADEVKKAVVVVRPAVVHSGAGAAANREGEAALLIQAYHLLERADHDYHGHRRHAMNQIEQAGKLLHANVHGDGPAGESQAASDAQLQSARALLEQARSEFATRKRTRLLNHTDAALRQLAIALSVK